MCARAPVCVCVCVYTPTVCSHVHRTKADDLSPLSCRLITLQSLAPSANKVDSIPAARTRCWEEKRKEGGRARRGEVEESALIRIDAKGWKARRLRRNNNTAEDKCETIERERRRSEKIMSGRRRNNSQGEWGVKKAKKGKQVSTALRVIGPLAWTIHLKLIFQLGPAGHSESISNWSLCQRSGKLAVELIRNIVVLGGSDRETYHNAQQEMGSEPPG